ncbi:radical SAM protein [Desulfofundulus thermobenzoicus]|uniref:Radical SAM protein n=1 Tax=Desulfofundulus thermobenzoicus TaxID=29376 RepID=A0A6N7ISQ4_9FIRM|nr:radical SAM protein [Desulfofundulus thermobenzoicus]MQL53104.1 radical SAM protein [Desulfofundulus thermobenzoicus]
MDFRLVYADEAGRFFDHPGLAAVGRTGDRFVEITPRELIPLPEGASLVLIPGGHPVGLDRRGNFVLLEHLPGKGRSHPSGEWADHFRSGGGPDVQERAGRERGALHHTRGASARAFALAALLPQGYTRTLLPAYRRPGGEKPLPLFGYTAVAWGRGRLWAAARRTDDPQRWDPRHYNTPELPGLVQEGLKKHPGNPILAQLAHCALDYSCFTAQNIFYRRWEGGVPVSPVCNARCLGCISEQPAGCCPSPQGRIKTSPSLEAVVEICGEHLRTAAGAIVSFGQGCEGEPALAAGVIAPAVARVRRTVSRGTVNMNTNAGHTAGIERVVDAGVDSLRVSLISARPEIYNAYHRPRGYGLEDVARSIKLARRAGVFVSLNLLVLPGLTDREGEIRSLLAFIRETGVQMVQLRNLNIDPDYLFDRLPPCPGEPLGIPQLIHRLQQIEGLLVGNFSRDVHSHPIY